MPILLWLLGVPISVIILLMLFGFLRWMRSWCGWLPP